MAKKGEITNAALLRAIESLDRKTTTAIGSFDKKMSASIGALDKKTTAAMGSLSKEIKSLAADTDKSFALLGKHMLDLDRRLFMLEKTVNLLDGRVALSDENIRHLDASFVHASIVFQELVTEVRAKSKAVDKDAVMVIDFEKRLKIVEKKLAVA